MTRVFTQPIAVTADVIAGGDTGSSVVYVAQEDMTIIGFQLTTKMLSTTPIGNDGFVDIDFELSPVTNIAVAFGYGFVHAMAAWNTTPAFGYATNGVVTVMFPDGKGITLKEGESVNLPWSGRNSSAATVRMTCDGTIYLIKGIRKS